MSSARTVVELLKEAAPDAVAVRALERMGLTYAALRDHVAQVVDMLNGMGLGRRDRIAIVLPNGPEMAT
ncbi:MAG: AMP-binding protein, partial [Dehalococcoidia bacterium]